VKDENIVGGFEVFVVFAGKVESNVEQFATVEFAVVVGLFDDVNVVVEDFFLVEEFGEEFVHVGEELVEVGCTVLGGVYVAVGDDDGYACGVGEGELLGCGGGGGGGGFGGEALAFCVSACGVRAAFCGGRGGGGGGVLFLHSALCSCGICCLGCCGEMPLVVFRCSVEVIGLLL